MNRCIVFLCGYCCSGKSTLAKYVSYHYGVENLNLRRMFESEIDDSEDASRFFFSLNEEKGDRTGWLDYLEKRIGSKIQGDGPLLIEGIFSYQEALWFIRKFHSKGIILEVNSLKENRIARLCSRECKRIEDAESIIELSDFGRKEGGMETLIGHADHVLYNNGILSEFYHQIDRFFESTIPYPGLLALCCSLNRTMRFHFSPETVVFFIRHVSIAIGCHNSCTHCFSNAPWKLRQTELSGFTRIINEIGDVLKSTHRSLSFFHLGAATDPAFITDYSKYLRSWISSFPDYQPIKVFSHGWDFSDPHIKKEFDLMMDVIRENSGRPVRVILSFDKFSLLARNNWERYLQVVSENLESLLRVLGKASMRVEVFYPPSRLRSDAGNTLEYWRKQAILGDCPSLLEILDHCNPQDECGKVTDGIVRIFKNLGLCSKDLVDMTRDCNIIFPAGRGLAFFGENEQERIEGLETQKQRVLYSLSDYEYGYEGVIINPDGTAQMVNYLGFALGPLLDEGQRVIRYMEEIKQI